MLGIKKYFIMESLSFFFSPLYRRFDMTHLFGFIVYSLFRIIKLGSMHLFVSYLTKYGYFGRIYSDKFENYAEIYL